MTATQIFLTEMGLLMVMVYCGKALKQFTVFRSPALRNDDKIIQPLMGEVLGQCVTVEHKEVLDDPGFRLGVSEHYVVSVHDGCPNQPHVCNADPEQIFSMKGATA